MSDMTPTVLECSGTTVLEPSFSDLVVAIYGAAELSQQRRRHWLCSVRQIAEVAGSSAHGDPCPLELGADFGGPIASRPRRRHGQDPGEP